MRIEPLNFRVEALLKNRPWGILLYGSDEGLIDYLVWEIREFLKKRGDALIRVEEASFLEAPHVYLTADLFSTKEDHFILLEDTSDKHIKFYKEFFTNPQKSTLILTASKLRAASSFVQWSLQNPHFWSVACYPLEERTKGLLFQRGAQRFHLEFPLTILKDFLPNLPIGEMPQLFQKLALYKKGPITSDVLESCWGHTLTDHIDLAYALSGRDIVALNRWISGPDPDVLLSLRQALRHFVQLLAVRSALSQQESLDIALRALSPPVFFKQLPLFKKHLSLWSLGALSRAIGLLVQTEIAFKRGNLTRGYVPFLRMIIT